MKDWILYEDNHIIIVNKPSKLPVQGDKTGDNTLLDIGKEYIKKTYNKLGNVYLGLPHRIDRPVSGIVILSKTSKSLSRMTRLFREKNIKKTYWAIVKNKINQNSGELIHFLKKNRKLNKSFVGQEEQKGFLKSQLKYKLLKKLNNYFLYEIELITGRHHQIRVQLSAIGSPIKGDIKYNAKGTNKDASINLHSRNIKFIHPIKKTEISITAPTPNDPIWKSC
ncbi:MAG: RluA family pseudouridine synthase [Flavobacteriales bacterium TMED191]|nr:MAG: RluA family pseudouridine synthase [Flavobacteriales bacterium TMED191]|tara:strand:- start:836 stop:1504 length:669 start_codon:yes stop_codon:yes gene_type:complete